MQSSSGHPEVRARGRARLGCNSSVPVASPAQRSPWLKPQSSRAQQRMLRQTPLQLLLRLAAVVLHAQLPLEPGFLMSLAAPGLPWLRRIGGQVAAVAPSSLQLSHSSGRQQQMDSWLGLRHGKGRTRLSHARQESRPAPAPNCAHLAAWLPARRSR